MRKPVSIYLSALFSSRMLTLPPSRPWPRRYHSPSRCRFARHCGKFHSNRSNYRSFTAHPWSEESVVFGGFLVLVISDRSDKLILLCCALVDVIAGMTQFGAMSRLCTKFLALRYSRSKCDQFIRRCILSMKDARIMNFKSESLDVLQSCSTSTDTSELLCRTMHDSFW